MVSSRSLRPASIWWFIAGYAGVAGFLLLEAFMRRRGSASDLDTSAVDDGTTRQVATAYVAAVLGAPILRRLAVRRLPAFWASVGLVILLIGLLGLDLWCWLPPRQMRLRSGVSPCWSAVARRCSCATSNHRPSRPPDRRRRLHLVRRREGVLCRTVQGQFLLDCTLVLLQAGSGGVVHVEVRDRSSW